MHECINRYCLIAAESHRKPKNEVKHVSCPLRDKNGHLQVLTYDNWRRSASITSLMPVENRRELMPDHGYRPGHLDRSDMKHNPSWYTMWSTQVQRPNWVVSTMGDQDVRTWFKRIAVLSVTGTTNALETTESYHCLILFLVMNAPANPPSWIRINNEGFQG